MKIGIDLRALQTGHKFRGIGEVTKQVTNRILQLAESDMAHDVSFIFYEYEDDDPKKLLNIPKALEYEVIKLGTMPDNDKISGKPQKLRRHLRDMYGHPIKGSSKSDVFLQFDYAFGVPKNTKTVLIKHDLIPYIFWSKYFDSAAVSIKNKAVRTTLRILFNNHKYMRQLRRGLKDAHTILSVSNSTKNDIERYFRVNPTKVKVAHLGVDLKIAKTSNTSTPSQLPTKPYLLFIGAGDERRRVDDLVAAYNNLKAQGEDIQLALVGENFKDPSQIPTASVRNAVQGSSYRHDILTLGYVDDKTKQQLYTKALAYVYPTKYEGFGIPVLEAMLFNCPVVAYKNSSIPEVGGEHVMYATDWQDIVRDVRILLRETEDDRRKRTQLARQYAQQFTWERTASIIYDELIEG